MNADLAFVRDPAELSGEGQAPLKRPDCDESDQEEQRLVMVLNVYEYVRSVPTDSIDPVGLDVWVAGPQTGEPLGHKSINVGDPNGSYDSYSFGLPSWWYMFIPYRSGIIYTFSGYVCSNVDYDRYRSTSRSEDDSIKGILDSVVGKRMQYGLTYGNCRQFSEGAFDAISDSLPPRHGSGGSF